MLKALFINSSSKKCSIYQSGKMIFDCLRQSKKVSFDYIEIDSDNRFIPVGYDFYLFNYHYATMGWLDLKELKRHFSYIMTIVLEVLPNNPFPLVDDKAFDAYLAIDPTMESDNPKVFAFPRPLEKTLDIDLSEESETPIIGSFGMPTHGKGFDLIIKAINKEFDKAIFRLNLSKADFVPNYEEIIQYYTDLCRQTAKSGIEVQVTSDFMTKEELIKWCASNTINCFFYDRNQPGLSATTDQAITSGRPLLISDNPTFRHIHKYIKPYPEWSIKEAIVKTPSIIKQIQKDWSQEAFAATFDDMISKLENDIKNAHAKIELKKKVNVEPKLCQYAFYLFNLIPFIKVKFFDKKKSIELFGIPFLTIKIKKK